MNAIQRHAMDIADALDHDDGTHEPLGTAEALAFLAVLYAFGAIVFARDHWREVAGAIAFALLFYAMLLVLGFAQGG